MGTERREREIGVSVFSRTRSRQLWGCLAHLQAEGLMTRLLVTDHSSLGLYLLVRVFDARLTLEMVHAIRPFMLLEAQQCGSDGDFSAIASVVPSARVTTCTEALSDPRSAVNTDAESKMLVAPDNIDLPALSDDPVGVVDEELSASCSSGTLE